MKDFFKNILLSLFSIVIFLFLAEGSLRLIDFVKSNYFPKHEEVSGVKYHRLINNPKLVYELVPGSYKDFFINSRGYRGPEFTEKKEGGVFRIFCVGDSCTFSGYPNYWGKDQRFTINGNQYEVINGGVEGYRSWQALERLRFSIKYDPDLVIIFIGNNDIYNTPPKFEHYMERSFFVEQVINFRRYIMTNSLFVHKVRQFIWGYAKHIVFKKVLKPEDFDKTRIYTHFYPDSYEKNLLEMIKICRNKNIQVALATLPCIVSPDMSEAAINRAHVPFFTSHLGYVKILYDKYNDVIRNISKKENLTLIDLAEEFEQMPDKEKYFKDLIHMYPPGYKICKDTVEKSLIEAHIIY